WSRSSTKAKTLMRIQKTISFPFVIALVLGFGTHQIAAQEGGQTANVSTSPLSPPPASDSLITKSEPAPASLNGAEAASERKSERLRPNSERLEVEVAYSYEHLTKGFAP